MYNIVKNVIVSKNYDLKDILNKIENMWVRGKLTEDQKEELMSLARNEASVDNSINVFHKLEELDRRVRALEEASANAGDPEVPGEEEIIPAYVEGKYYYTGDKVTFEDQTYVCVAPKGATCVWSPKDYPAYWEVV